MLFYQKLYFGIFDVSLLYLLLHVPIDRCVEMLDCLVSNNRAFLEGFIFFGGREMSVKSILLSVEIFSKI